MIGMGGGVFLLAVMFSFLPHTAAIQLHAGVQLISHFARIVAYAKDLDWRTLGRFLTGAVPGTAISMLLVMALKDLEHSEPYLKILVGTYIIVAAHLPPSRGQREGGRPWEWPMMGLVAGVASLCVGAVGPMIGPLFVRRDFLKERLIATKAGCTFFLHAIKIPALWYIGAETGAGLPWREFGWLAVVIGAATIVGTWCGKKLLRHVSERLFVGVFKAALTLAGMKTLAWDGILQLTR
jgi:uncharacterized membrane protein YfcA